MKKNAWMKHLEKEWNKEKGKKEGLSYSEVMRKAKKSYKPSKK